MKHVISIWKSDFTSQSNDFCDKLNSKMVLRQIRLENHLRRIKPNIWWSNWNFDGPISRA